MAASHSTLTLNVASKPIPEIRRLLAEAGLPSDLDTAMRVRKAARANALRWDEHGIQITDGDRPRLEAKSERG